MDVAAWLRGLGLERYEQEFLENEIDEEVLPSLTAEDLKDLGVVVVGHRRRLLDAIAALGTASSAATVTAPSEAPAPPLDAERRQLTVMFCDLVGSTALSSRLDPEDLREIIGAYHRAIAEAVAGFDGFIAKYMGDGVLVYFGYPHAHEDDAERAVHSGLAVIEAVGRLPAQEGLKVRLGIATGLAVVGDLIGEGAAQERGVVGETPNLAARLQALAAPDTLVIGEATRRQIGELFDLEDLGPQALAGFGEPQRAWRVLGESDAVSRFEALRLGETPLVGREEEVELLVRRWEQAKNGEGRVVLISGEPGIGKSRLTAALSEHIESEPHARLRYFCSPHHQDSALHPFIAQLERSAGFARDDTPDARLGKLRSLLAPGAQDERDLALLSELLSLPSTAPDLSPQRKREKLFEALLNRLEAEARQRLVLMVFEDAHWIDPTSRELLDLIVDRVRRLPVLLVITFRPEFQPPWSGRAHVMSLALNRLGERAGEALVHTLAGNAGLTAEIVAEIVERTDGVPLFVEELTKAVLESAGQADRVATVLGTASPAALSVPATLHASLMARLDRLGPLAKEIAQIGAAIGREFSYELLSAAAARGDAERQAALAQLVAAGLLFQRGVPPIAEYQFKHALVQDTAYGTLLRGSRQVLHARIAEAMRQRSPDIAERQPELLAHHFAEAGQLEKAAAYWLEAGQLAAARSATVEAVTHLRRGIEASRSLPDTTDHARQELQMQLALGPALLSMRGFQAPEANGAYRRARELAEKLGDDRPRFAALWGLWLSTGSSYRVGGPRDEIVTELFRVSDQLDDPGLRLQAYHCAWPTSLNRGDIAAAEEHARAGLLLYDRDAHRDHALVYGGHDPGVCGWGQGALAQWLLGRPDEAARSVREALALGESLTHIPSRGHALWFAGVAHLMWRDTAAVLDYGERLVRLGTEHRLAQYLAIGGILRGWARARSGECEAGAAEERQAIVDYIDVAKVQLSIFYAVLAEVELSAGNYELARQTLAGAKAHAEAATEILWLPEIFRIEGDLSMAGLPPDPTAAEQRYREALALARDHGSRSLELRAATSLARLWRQQHRIEKAHDLLAPIYGWFTEGFDTADLQEAKVLLADLN